MADATITPPTEGTEGTVGTGEKSRQGLAQFVMAVKKVHPNISDQEAVQYYDDLNAAAGDPDKIKAANSKLFGPEIPQVAKPLNTELADPLKGAGYTQADLLKQFSPAQIQAAYADQQKMYQASQPSRLIGNILAGGSGSGDVMTANQAQWNAIDAQNKLQSLERQKSLQEGATAGLEAATKAQTMAKTAGEYAGSQQAKQEEINQARQKTQTGALGVAAQQRLNTPGTPESLLAVTMLMDQFKAAGVPMPQGIDPKNVTAQQIMGFMDPKVLDAYKTKVGIAQTQAETGKTKTETAGIQQSQKLVENQTGIGAGGTTVTPSAPAQPAAPAESAQPTAINAGPNTRPVFNFAPGTDLRVMRAAMASQPANVLEAFDRQFPDVKDATGPVYAPQTANAQAVSRIQRQGGTLTPNQSAMTPQRVGAPIAAALKAQPAAAGSGWRDDLYGPKPSPSVTNPLTVSGASTTGGATLSQPGYVAQRADAGQREITGTNDFIKSYDSSIAPNVSYAFTNATPEYTGRINSLGKNAQNDPQWQKMSNSVDSLNQAAAELGIIPSSANNAAGATTMGAMGAAVSAAGGMPGKIVGGILSTAAGSMGGKQAVTANSPDRVIKDLALRVETVKAQQAALLPYKREYAQNTNYNMDNFINTPIYKTIMDPTKTIPMVDMGTGKVELVPKEDYEKRKELAGRGYKLVQSQLQ